jgi:hypothetical protein
MQDGMNVEKLAAQVRTEVHIFANQFNMLHMFSEPGRALAFL